MMAFDIVMVLVATLLFFTRERYMCFFVVLTYLLTRILIWAFNVVDMPYPTALFLVLFLVATAGAITYLVRYFVGARGLPKR